MKHLIKFLNDLRGHTQIYDFLLILKPKLLLWQFYLFTRQNITCIDFFLFSRTRGRAFFKCMYKCIKISLFLSLYPPPPPQGNGFAVKQTILSIIPIAGFVV